MEQLEKNLFWQILVCLNGYYTRTLCDSYIILTTTLIALFGMCTYSLPFSILIGLVYLSYLTISYFTSYRYYSTVIEGWLLATEDGADYTIKEMAMMIESPKLYYYEISKGYELGRSVRDM